MTPKLPIAALDRARDYVDQHARPLERARLAHLLGDLGPEGVTRELAAFVTDQGGAGRAIESDCRAPEPSVLGALTALDILRMHAVPADDPLVAELCAWVVGHVESDHQGRLVWPFLPPSAQASPHAPWWDQCEPEQLAASFLGFLANPGVALTAHLWRHEAAAPGSVPGEVLAATTRQAVDVAAAGVSSAEVNAHDALAHFAAEEAVPAPARQAVTTYLRRVLPDRVMSRPEDFTAYGIHPLWIAPTPGHPLSATIADQIALALEQTIASQESDGSWAPFWDWGGWHPEIWAQAEREWRGVLAVRNIAALAAHGALSQR